MKCGVGLRAWGAGPALLALVLSLAALPLAQEPALPRRIISLVPAVTEMLFAIGAGDAVVGVSSYDRFPPEVSALPSVGALVDPDFERILSLRPDLVVVYGTQDDLIGRLGRARIAVFPYVHAGLADVTGTIRRVGARVDRTAQAETVARRVETGIEAIRRRVAGRPRLRTAIVIEREHGTLRGIYASGGIGFMHDLLDVAGGTNVFADVTRQAVQVTVEPLLARRPDVILEIRPAAGWTPAAASRERLVWSGLPSLPAVRAGRIHILTDDRLSIPGPRVADAARLIADALHPETKSPAR